MCNMYTLRARGTMCKEETKYKQERHATCNVTQQGRDVTFTNQRRQEYK